MYFKMKVKLEADVGSEVKRHYPRGGPFFRSLYVWPSGWSKLVIWRQSLSHDPEVQISQTSADNKCNEMGCLQIIFSLSNCLSDLFNLSSR